MSYYEDSEDLRITTNILNADSRQLDLLIADTKANTYQWNIDKTPADISRIGKDIDSAYQLIKDFEIKGYTLWISNLTTLVDTIRVKYNTWLDTLAQKGYYTPSHILSESISALGEVVTPHISIENKENIYGIVVVVIALVFLTMIAK